jgi:predicted DNA-binding ribbon-helix-helix protein
VPTSGKDGVVVDYAPARKRSVTVAGHETSVLLEPAFWDVLDQAANDAQIPLNALIARIDAERLEQSRFANRRAPNLASAIRLWALAFAQGPSKE